MTKGIVWKKKINKYISSFDFIVYVLLHATILVTIEGKWCAPTCFNIWLFQILLLLLLLLFWNKLGHLIQIFRWSYIMTHDLM